MKARDLHLIPTPTPTPAALGPQFQQEVGVPQQSTGVSSLTLSVSPTVHPGESAQSRLLIPLQEICFTSLPSLVKSSSKDCLTLPFMSSQMTTITANEARGWRRHSDFKFTQSQRPRDPSLPLPTASTFPTFYEANCL